MMEPKLTLGGQQYLSRLNLVRWALGFCLLGLHGCAWFQEPLPPSPTANQGPSKSLPAERDQAAPTDSTLIASVEDSTAAEEGISLPEIPVEQTPPSTPANREPVPEEEEGDEGWDVRGENLQASTVNGARVYQMDLPIITHRDLILTGDKGTYFLDTKSGRLIGNVTFVDSTMTGKSERARYDGIREVLVAENTVEIQSDSLYLVADRGEYRRKQNTMRFSGKVRGFSGGRRMNADEATWFRDSDEVLMMDNVRVRDEAEETWITGNRLLYDVQNDLARVTGSPELVVQSEDGGSLRIQGDRLWLREEGAARAGGNVKVYRGGVVAYADSAIFDRDARLATLLGSPRVEDASGTMLGDTLYLHFDEQEALDKAEVQGNAFVRYAPVDERKGETSVVQGDELWMFFDGNAVERILASGNAKSSYRPPPTDDPDETGTNVAKGDSITIFLDEGEVETVVINGNASGVYTFGAGPATGSDSLAAPQFPGDRSVSGDSLGAVGDSLDVGSLPVDVVSDSLEVPAGEDTLDVRTPVSLAELEGRAPRGRERVEYKADRVTFVLKDVEVLLENNAVVDYGEVKLKSNRVTFHADKKYLEAEDDPILIDNTGGDSRELVGERMDYNLETREGTIDDGRTEAEDGFIYADRLRQVGEDDFMAKQGNFTTCDNVAHGKHAHFHFTSKKMRIYLKDKVIVRPVTLYIRDIPIVAIPFYVFSIRKGRQSGLLTPDFDFGFGSTGRSFSNLGYYWATNEYLDLQFRLDYQEKPTSRFVGDISGRYKKRYLMDGDFRIRQTIGDDTIRRDFSAGHSMTLGKWRVTAEGEFRDEGFRESEPLNNNLSQRLDRLLSSDLSLSRNFDFGARLSASMSRREDLATELEDGNDERVITETLPRYSFSINQRPIGRVADENGEGGFLPFLSRTSWRFSSTGSLQRTVDEQTTVTQPIVLDGGGNKVPRRDDDDGVHLYQDLTQPADPDSVFRLVSERTSSARHELTLRDRRDLFGKISFGPSFSARENWVDREFSATDTVKSFNRALTWDASFGSGTTLYGTFPGVGPLQAIRHTFEPDVSFTYQPEFGSLSYTDSLGVKRNRFQGVTSRERQFLSLRANNRFQAKVQSEEQVNRVDLLNWSLDASYDLLADDDPWSDINSRIDLQRIQGVGLNFRSRHDPYENFRFNTFSAESYFAFNGTLPGPDAGSETGGSESVTQERRPDINRRGGDVYDSGSRIGSQPASGRVLGWSANFGLTYSGQRLGGELDTNSQLTSNLSLQITKNWSLTYRNIWNITEKDIRGESFSLRRDLHCWEASFTGSRLGDDTSFYFRINVKQLQEVKYEQGRSGGSGAWRFDRIFTLETV